MITISKLDITKHNHQIISTRSSTYNKHSKAAIILSYFASSIIVKGQIWDFLLSKFKPLLNICITICGQNCKSQPLNAQLLFHLSICQTICCLRMLFCMQMYLNRVAISISFEITWFSKSNNCRVRKYVIVEFCSPLIFTLFY